MTAVLDEATQLTEIWYRAVFDMDRNAIAIRLGLSPNEFHHGKLMDKLGNVGVLAIYEIETELTAWLRQRPLKSVSFEQMKDATQRIAGEIGTRYKEMAKEHGIDLLTASGIRPR